MDGNVFHLDLTNKDFPACVAEIRSVLEQLENANSQQPVKVYDDNGMTVIHWESVPWAHRFSKLSAGEQMIICCDELIITGGSSYEPIAIGEHTLGMLPKPKENAEYRLPAKLGAIMKLLCNKLINGVITCRK